MKDLKEEIGRIFDYHVRSYGREHGAGDVIQFNPGVSKADVIADLVKLFDRSEVDSLKKYIEALFFTAGAGVREVAGCNDSPVDKKVVVNDFPSLVDALFCVVRDYPQTSGLVMAGEAGQGYKEIREKIADIVSEHSDSVVLPTPLINKLQRLVINELANNPVKEVKYVKSPLSQYKDLLEGGLRYSERFYAKYEDPERWPDDIRHERLNRIREALRLVRYL